MNSLKYHDYAIDYGHIPHPVIVTDLELNALYFNPAASQCDVILMQGDLLRRAADSRAMQHIRLCRSTGQTCRFSMTLGENFTRRFSVTLSRQKEELVFELAPRSTPQQQKLEQILAPYSFGYELITRSTLHQLLGTAEILEQSEEEFYRTLGSKSRRQVLRSLRIAGQIEYLESDFPCHIVDFSKLLSLTMEQAGEFIDTRLQKKLHFTPGTRQINVKCNAPIMRSILLNLLACAYEQDATEVYVDYTVTAHQLVVMLRSDGSRDIAPENEKFLTPLLPWVEIARRLIHRMQGSLQTVGTGKHLRFCLTMPIAYTDGAVNKNLKELFNDQIPQLELAFSELI